MKRIINLPKWILKLEAKVAKDFGPRCREYHPYCTTCNVYNALVVLGDVYRLPLTKKQIKEAEKLRK